MRTYSLLVLASFLSVSQAIKCQKCESSQGGDCNSGNCDGLWCTAQILENKATGSRQINKNCTANNPTGAKEDGCVKDPTPPDGSESYRCACNSNDFCNSETNVVRMQAMLNNRFIVGAGSQSGGPNQQSGQQQPPPPGTSNQFPLLSPNGPGPNGTFVDGQQFQPGSVPGQQQPGGSDLGSQQQPGSPNRFVLGNPNSGQPSSSAGGNPQFPSSNGDNVQFPQQSGGNPSSPQGGTNPQFPPQGGNNAFPGTNVQQGAGSNPQGQPGGPQGAGSNPQNPQFGSGQQFPASGGGGGFGGSSGHSPTDSGVTGTRPNISGQPDSGSNDHNQANSSTRTGGSQKSGPLTCSCNEPSCTGPCKGAVCYRLTFPANSVQSQAFAGKQGDIEQLGCSDDTNVLIGGGNSIQRQIKDYRFRVNGQEVVVPVAQGFYCRERDYCSGAGILSLATSALVLATALALVFRRY